MTATTLHTGAIRCTQVECPAMQSFTYATLADKAAVLAANSEQPWACKPAHKRKAT